MRSTDSPPLDPRTVDLLRTVARVMSKYPRVKYAIGGGIAVICHGVTRNTADVDVFLKVKEADKAKLLGAFRAEGLIIDAPFPPYHYFVFRLEHGDPRVRIDLLFTNNELELDAVTGAERSGMWGVEFNVFPPDLLAAIKWNTQDLRHRGDVQLMLDRGVVTPAAVHQALDKWRLAQARKPKKNPWPRQ